MIENQYRPPAPESDTLITEAQQAIGQIEQSILGDQQAATTAFDSAVGGATNAMPKPDSRVARGLKNLKRSLQLRRAVSSGDKVQDKFLKDIEKL